MFERRAALGGGLRAEASVDIVDVSARSARVESCMLRRLDVLFGCVHALMVSGNLRFFTFSFLVHPRGDFSK